MENANFPSVSCLAIIFDLNKKIKFIASVVYRRWFEDKRII